LSVNDEVLCFEYSGLSAWRVMGMGGNDGGAGKTRVSEVWESDFGAVALQSDADGNIGIGTAGPDAKLDVLTTAGAQLRLTSENEVKFTDFTVDANHNLAIDPTSTGEIKLNATVTVLDEIQRKGDADTKIGFTADKQTFTVGGLVAFQITNTAQNLVEIGDVAGGGDWDVNVNSGQMFLRGSDGFLGIGTSSPSKRLDLGDGDLTTSGEIISTGGSQTGKFLTGLAGNTVFSFSGDNFDIRAGSGSSASQNVMRVTSAGDFGIGTNNPVHKLDIIQASATPNLAGINTLHSGNVTGIAYGLIAQAQGTSTTNVGAYLSATGATNNYGLIVESGQAGIGTTLPNELLEISDTTDPTLRIDNALGSLSASTIIGSIEWFTNDGSTGGTNISALVENVAEGVHTANRVKTSLSFQVRHDDATMFEGIKIFGETFGSSPSDARVVLVPNEGNVGIGTAAPGKLVEILGNASNSVGILGVGKGTAGGFDATLPSGVLAGVSMQPTIDISGNSALLFGGYMFLGANVQAGVTLSNLSSMYVDVPVKTGPGTITTAYGLYVNNPTVGATNVGAYFAGNVGIGIALPNTRLDIGAGALEGDEMTTPAAGAANTYRLFARDDGGGDTELCVRFNTGLVQVIAPLEFGEISRLENAVATALTVTTPAQYLFFDTNGVSNGATPDHTNDHITVNKTGTYLIICSITAASVGGGAVRIEFTILKNNGATLVGALHADRDLAGGGGDVGSISLSGLAVLTSGDTIELWLENETNNNGIVIEDAILSIAMVGVNA
ncbi:hypothetical protein LCGC14_1699860, partial [marine sediment metagenome]